MDSRACSDVKINTTQRDRMAPTEECLEDKCNSELSRISGGSNGWWSNDAEEKLESRQRWSYGSDTSIEAMDSIQNRLCCSPVDEFDSTVSSETEDLIVNNTEEGIDTYKACIQTSPVCSPTFKNVLRNGNDEKQSSDVYTDDDELIDYSKRYTTDNSASMVGNKNVDSRVQQQQQRQQQQKQQGQHEQQQRRMVVHDMRRPVPQKKTANSRPKRYPFGDYAETDLDQPTDYSLRYAEEDTDDEEKEECRFYRPNTQEDVIKTYYTEGTPSNFSTATSMSDLSMLGDTRESEEQFLREQKRENIEKSEKSNAKDCGNKAGRKFGSDDSKILIPEEARETPSGAHCSNDRQSEKLRTPARSSAEASNGSSKENRSNSSYKHEENNYAQETPLMFSRSSSLDSLSEFEQLSIQDDHSSVISDFSHRTSGVVSPSELPDSPTQTVPPSPRRLERESFPTAQQQQQQQEQQRRRMERERAQSSQQPPLKLQPQPVPQSQTQKMPPRNSAHPTHPHLGNGHASLPHRAQNEMRTPPTMQHSSNNGQVPLVQRQQINNNNRMALLQRPQPEGQASLVQHSQANSRMPIAGQRSQIENRAPAMQRPRMDRPINAPRPPVQQQQQMPHRIPERCMSVFEDNLVRFNKSEEAPGKLSSAASCLSALTIDDEDENVSVDNREIINRIAAIRVRSSAAGMHQAPCTQSQNDNATDRFAGRQPQLNVLNRHPDYRNNGSHTPPRKDELRYVDVDDDESHDYTTSYFNREEQNNRYRDFCNDSRNYNRNRTINKPDSKSPICKQRNNNNNNDIICRRMQKMEISEIVVVDTTQSFYTEDTPIFASPYGSESNLSGLSALSISDDDYDDYFFRYGLIENERSNSRANTYEDELGDNGSDVDEDEDNRRIDVSPFESQMNLNFCIKEEDEEELEREREQDEAEQRMHENGKKRETERRLSFRNSECSDDEEERLLEQCIKSGVSKVTRRSLVP